jgi:hypothetical protein
VSVEPAPPDPTWPRYGTRPLPPYRFVPGRTPHPRLDPGGHSRGRPEPKPIAPAPEAWRSSESYLHGIDLYNFAYWWEAHEELEGLWHAAGREGVQAGFFQGLIQIAASNLKLFMGVPTAAQALADRGLARLDGLGIYMGVDVAELEADVRAHLAGERGLPALIRLSF